MLTATDMVQRWEWVRHGLCKEPSDDGRIALSWTPSEEEERQTKKYVEKFGRERKKRVWVDESWNAV